MAIFNFTHLNSLTQMKAIFPELTENQFQLVIMWTLWNHDIQQVAIVKGCQPDTVKKTLQKCRENMGLPNLDLLHSTVLMRLFMDMWKKLDQLTTEK